MDLFERVLADNARYAAGGRPSADRKPARGIAVVTCMDARIDVGGVLGLGPGDAHVRSLALSQWLIGTRSVLVVHHTDCALHRLHGPTFHEQLYEAAGQLPTWELGTFVDLDTSVRESVRRIATAPFLRYRDRVYGFVLDVASGRLRAVR